LHKSLETAVKEGKTQPAQATQASQVSQTKSIGSTVANVNTKGANNLAPLAGQRLVTSFFNPMVFSRASFLSLAHDHH
jgi:hypothetical protein